MSSYGDDEIKTNTKTKTQSSENHVLLYKAFNLCGPCKDQARREKTSVTRPNSGTCLLVIIILYPSNIYIYPSYIYPLYANLTYPNQTEPLYNKQNGESGQRYCVQVHSWCVGEEDEEVGDDFQPFVSSHLLFSPLFVFDINFSLTIAVAQNGPSNTTSEQHLKELPS